MKTRYFIWLVLPIFLSCSKKEDELTVSGEPTITFVNLTPREVEDFNNSLLLTIRYEDQDGDIGYDDPDAYSLWVKDSRLDSADWYHIPPLAPPGHNLAIAGHLNIVLNRMFILGNGNEEIVTLSVKLRDRSGHWSNVINTPTITIQKP